MSIRLSAGRLSFVRQAGGTFLVRIAGAAIGLITAVVVSRTLGPIGRGEFAGAMALAALGMQVGNLGFPSSNTYFVSREPQILPSLVANSIAIAGIVGAGLAIVFSALKFGFGLFEQTSPPLVGAAMLWIPFGLVYLLLSNLLLGTGQVRRFNLVELALRLTTMLGTLAAVALWPAPSALMLFAVGLGAQAAAACIVYAAIPSQGRKQTPASWALLKRQLPFSIKSYLALLFAFALLKIDLLMVQAISGNAEAGFYSIAASMADMLYMLPAAIGLILFPRLAASDDRRHRARATSALLGYTGMLMAGAAAISWVLAPLAVRLLFGAEFLPAAGMFRVLAFAICLYGLNNILSNHFMAEGLPWPAVWVWVLAVVINVGLNLVWIPLYGGIGASAASLVAYAAVLAMQGLLFLRATGRR